MMLKHALMQDWPLFICLLDIDILQSRRDQGDDVIIKNRRKKRSLVTTVSRVVWYYKGMPSYAARSDRAVYKSCDYSNTLFLAH